MSFVIDIIIRNLHFKLLMAAIVQPVRGFRGRSRRRMLVNNQFGWNVETFQGDDLTDVCRDVEVTILWLQAHNLLATNLFAEFAGRDVVKAISLTTRTDGYSDALIDFVEGGTAYELARFSFLI